jgi:hypothetical protein
MISHMLSSFVCTLLLRLRSQHTEKTGLEKKEHIVSMMRNQIVRIDNSGRYHYEFKLKVGNSIFHLCEKAFSVVHDISLSTVWNYSSLIKDNIVSFDTTTASTSSVHEMKRLQGNLSDLGVDLPIELIGVINLADNERAHLAFIWLKTYTELAACRCPKTSKLQIETCTLKEMHFIYEQDSIQAGSKPYSLPYFGKILRECFPNVSFRKTKSVTGAWSSYFIFIYLRNFIFVL